MGKNICVLIEHEGEEVKESSLEVLLEARRLADKIDCSVTALLIGSDAVSLYKGLGRYGADKACIVGITFCLITPLTVIQNA